MKILVAEQRRGGEGGEVFTDYPDICRKNSQMPDPGTIRIKDFDYQLPHGMIAQFPLPTRDASKLLVCRQGRITDDLFSNIGKHLPSDSLLVFNNTRVIHARLIFTKPTGGQVEIFCLEPVSPVSEIQAAFRQRSGAVWKCLVGNLKRWKSGTLSLATTHESNLNTLFAERVGNPGDGCFEIQFHWDPPEKSFAEILEVMGLIPLPPYIDRAPENIDNERYQTVYAAREGSVAAPTAGLHFTNNILEQLRSSGIETEHVTLHVGMGTFRPVVAEEIGDHLMHGERIVVTRKVIERLLDNRVRPVFAVGTTSARTLESLYWLGVRLICDGPCDDPVIDQWDPYRKYSGTDIRVSQALESLLRHLDEHRLEEFSGVTRLMIVPGYRYRLLSGLVTNFHMPQSTLLLLVAAMIGEDWRTSYTHALQNDYRFLSYGDSCLFFNTSDRG